MDCQNADTPILADGLMSLMPLSIPTASNEADWREVRMWLREMAGMGLHRIESIMDGMTLILPTKLKSKISARAKSIIETAACTHSRIQDVQVSLLSNPIQRAQVIRPGDTGEDLCEGVIYMEKSKQLHAGTIRAYDAQTDKYSVLFQSGKTVEWELEQVCKMWGKGKNRQQWSQLNQEALGYLVLQVHGDVVSDTSHTLCTPFLTLLSSNVWTDTQTWYTCSVRRSLPPDIQNMLSMMGKAQDANIAKTMLKQKTVF